MRTNKLALAVLACWGDAVAVLRLAIRKLWVSRAMVLVMFMKHREARFRKQCRDYGVVEG